MIEPIIYTRDRFGSTWRTLDTTYPRTYDWRSAALYCGNCDMPVSIEWPDESTREDFTPYVDPDKPTRSYSYPVEPVIWWRTLWSTWIPVYSGSEWSWRKALRAMAHKSCYVEHFAPIEWEVFEPELPVSEPAKPKFFMTLEQCLAVYGVAYVVVSTGEVLDPLDIVRHTKLLNCGRNDLEKRALRAEKIIADAIALFEAAKQLHEVKQCRMITTSS